MISTLCVGIFYKIGPKLRKKEASPLTISQLAFSATFCSLSRNLLFSFSLILNVNHSAKFAGKLSGGCQSNQPGANLINTQRLVIKITRTFALMAELLDNQNFFTYCFIVVFEFSPTHTSFWFLFVKQGFSASAKPETDEVL